MTALHPDTSPAAASPGPVRFSPASSLAAMDPRVKLATALVLGPIIWRFGPGATAVSTLTLALLAFLTVPGSSFGPAALRGNAVFVILWAAAKALFDIWGGVAPAAACAESAVFGARLLSLICLGLILAASTSPRQMGAALSYALTPVLGRRAWKAALALALLVHNLPLAWTAGAAIRRTMRLRCPDLPFSRKPGLFATALLRAVSLTAYDRTMAVAARNLDRPEAWRPVFVHPWRGALPCALAVVLAAAGLLWP
ncbi:cobalt transporter [Desulfovibrio sulfodismutans]|uniref:Cobalt transporter n=1 Tax=Desulfolutivibrio sulfodismutans TaxID=63561 RepID=A0A7K3NP37_9BACT|nr:cobalt transporter [Desulfolutivibrio sulfodismutans]NDY57940.1 cobalt transporter [Desulfolutivibrio sulfodismutans]QLA10979.1 cobalt transporter [Desulfolutivibrio sulfodismutans DSM 3696]